jgi:hypothetical protein
LKIDDAGMTRPCPHPDSTGPPAAVHNETLTGDLEGDRPSGWKRSFEAVAARLNRGEWDHVGVKKDEVRVDGVTPGSEEKIRHFLESVIQQTNVDHGALDEASPDSVDCDGAEEPDGAGQGKDSPDAQMTAHFRQFADAPQDAA